MATSCSTIPSATIIDLQAGMKYLRMHWERESRPATPPWQINREILGGASKQAEPINALSIHSVNSLVDKSNFNAVADNFNAHAANFLLCQLFSSAGIRSAAFSLHHFQVIHNTQLCVGVFLYVLVLLSFSLYNFQLLHISNFVLASSPYFKVYTSRDWCSDIIPPD